MNALDQVLGSASADPDVARPGMDRFDAAWEAGGEPSIEDYLPGDPSVPIETLRQLVTELVMVDLEHRWRRAKAEGATTSGLLSADTHGVADTALTAAQIVEQYVERFRRILPEELVPHELIVWEFRVRHRWGNQPQVAGLGGASGPIRRTAARFGASRRGPFPRTCRADSGRRGTGLATAGRREFRVREFSQRLVAGGLVTMARLRAVYDQLPHNDPPQDLAGLAGLCWKTGT